MDWEEVTQSKTWDFETKKILEGAYIGSESGVGKNNSKLYTIQLLDGEMVGVWGSTVLDTRMKNLTLGEEVRIEYLGKKPSPTRKGSTYKDFKVFHRKGV